MAQEEYSRGDIYRATHETCGATALVLKPAAEDEKSSARLSDWRVRVISSASHSYFALEVEHTPMSVAPDTHSVESLVCTLEEVRKGVGRMEQALHASNASRPWRSLALSGTAALVVALLSATLAPVAEGRVQEEALEEAWAPDVHMTAYSGQPEHSFQQGRAPLAASPSPPAPSAPPRFLEGRSRQSWSGLTGTER